MPRATGKITIFGINGTIELTGTGIITSPEMALQNMGLDYTTQNVDLTDGEGKRLARHYFQPEARCNIEFIPFDPANPGTLATLKSKVFKPADGSQVNIDDTDVPGFDGDWNFSGKCGIRFNQKGHLVMTLEAERVGEDGDGNAAYLTPTP